MSPPSQPPAPSPRARLGPPLDRLSPEQWRNVDATVAVYARRITRGAHALASDLVQEAYARLLTTRPWDPASQPRLEFHLMGVVRSLLGEHYRQARRETCDDEAMEEVPASSPEKKMLDHADADAREARAARRYRELEERLAARGCDLELQLLDLMLEGVDGAAAQAERLGRPVAEVYRARARIQRFTGTVLAREDRRRPHDDGDERDDSVDSLEATS
jgi:hypothetical protein